MVKKNRKPRAASLLVLLVLLVAGSTASLNEIMIKSSNVSIELTGGQTIANSTGSGIVGVPPTPAAANISVPYLTTSGQNGIRQAFTMNQTLSDRAQEDTIAFDALAFLTGDLGADSFFPPGKVADFWGFQYLRDNDPSDMGHNTDFLTKAAYNMLYVLNDSQRSDLVDLAKEQVNEIDRYAQDRLVLIDAFCRLLQNDMPLNSAGLDLGAVVNYSAGLYVLDGQMCLERAQVMGNILHNLSTDQRAYLNSLKGKGMLEWPNVNVTLDMRSLGTDVNVAVMTYAGDMLSWYLGSVEADVYFCPERQGTYFGSFYLKDAPAMGNPNYSIGENITSDMGSSFLNVLNASQAKMVMDLVDVQRPFLQSIVDIRTNVSEQLRICMAGGTPDATKVLNEMKSYGELDGAIVYNYASTFAFVNNTLTDAQRISLTSLRSQLGVGVPDGAYLYSRPIAVPEIANSDFLFASNPSTSEANSTSELAVPQDTGYGGNIWLIVAVSAAILALVGATMLMINRRKKER